MMYKNLLFTGLIILCLPDSLSGQANPQLTEESSKLDSLTNALSLATDSLEVAGLCMEIFYHVAYGLIVKDPKEGIYLMRARRIYERNEKWDEAANANVYLGGLYYNRKQFDVARKYWYLAKSQYKKTNNRKGEMRVLSNLSEIYQHDSTHEAQYQLKAYLDSAIAIGEHLGDSSLLIDPYLNLGEWYNKKNDPQLAEKYIKTAITMAEKAARPIPVQLGVYQLGMVKKGQGDIQRAIYFIEKSLSYGAIRKNGVDYLGALFELSALYSTLGDYKKAYACLISYKYHKDTLFLEEHANALLNLEVAYETEKKEQEIKKRESDIALLAEQDKVKNQWILFGSIGLAMVFVFILLLRSRYHLKKQQKLQEKFSQALIQAQEDERTRIAKELHDSVGQQLTLIKKKAQNTQQHEFSALTNTALEEVRSISRGLYPASLKQLGLSESIGQLLYELDEEVDMFFSVDIDDIDELLDEGQTLNFYRFVQECVNNVIKHANARTLSVHVAQHQGQVTVLIRDNGCGFENVNSLRSESLGLKTIVERIRILKGTLSIRSTVGQGTTITAKIPVTE